MKRKTPQVVYFIKRTDGLIKIGRSGNLRGRLAEQYPPFARATTVILGVMPGTLCFERELHERFRHLRVGESECFRPEKELLDYIRALRLIPVDPKTMHADVPHRVCVHFMASESEAKRYAEFAREIFPRSKNPTIAAAIRCVMRQAIKEHEEKKAEAKNDASRR